MNIFINGEQQCVSENISVAALLDRLGIQKERIAVELNLEIVSRGIYPDTILKEGDKIEIVSFVGGG